MPQDTLVSRTLEMGVMATASGGAERLECGVFHRRFRMGAW